MSKKIQKILFVAALLLSGAMQAQCPLDELECPISFSGSDINGDGWNGNSISVYQNTILRGTFSLYYGSYSTSTINICSGDSVQLVWNAGQFPEEALFTVFNGNDDIVISGQGNNYTNGETIITFEPICPTCHSPSWMAFDSITENSVFIFWNPEGNESAWQVLLEDTTLFVTTNSCHIYGLTSNTNHTVYVRAVCNDDDSSSWTSATFRTLCSTLNTLPFSQNFNNCITGLNNLFDPCWSVYYSDSLSQYYPYVIDMANRYLCMNLYSSNPNNYSYAMLPEIGESIGDSEMELRFDVWHDYGYDSQLIVAIFDSSYYDGISNFDTVAIIDPTATSQEQAENVFVYIIDRNLTGKRIGFLYTYGNPMNGHYSCNIDNVILSHAPECFQPTNINANIVNNDSVMISWNSNSTSSSFVIVYGIPGFDPDTVHDNIVLVGNTSFGYIENLNLGHEYEAYVRTDCGIGYSDWSGPVNFATGAIIMGVTGDSVMSICDAIIYDNGGRYGDYLNNSDYTLTLYPINETKRFKFWGHGSIESCCDYLRIYDGVSANGTLLAEIQNDNTSLNTITTHGGPITLQFHSDNSTTKDGFVIHVTCEDIPSCLEVNDIAISEVSSSSAFIFWNNNNENLPTPNNYIVTIHDTAYTTTINHTVSEQYAMIVGLEPNTEYCVTVIPVCNEGDVLPATATFTTVDLSCLYVDTTMSFSDTIGSATGFSNYLPCYTYHGYSLSQQIFTSNEIGHSGQIEHISIMMYYVAQQRNFEIYMGHVNVDTAGSFLHPTDLTRVFDGGTVSMTANQWTTFNLTTPFKYNGNDNLLVVFRDITGSAALYNYSYIHNAPHGASMYISHPNTPIPLGSGVGTALSIRNNIILSGTPCDNNATCVAPICVVTDKSATSVSLMWAPGATDTSWTVEHKAENDNTWSVDYTATSLNSHTFTGLTPNTKYQFRVFHLCGTDTFATVRTIRTDCYGESIPFVEDFSSWEANNTGPAPNCWFKGSTYYYYYPYVTTSNIMGDGLSMRFHCSNDTYTYLALPKMEAPVDTLVVTGFINLDSYSNNSHFFKVGVMADAENYNTFHTVSNIPAIYNQWIPFEVSFSGQTDGYIAFSVSNDSYQDIYLDNIEVRYINPCAHPTSVSSDNITQTSADISWHGTTADSYIVEYGPRGFSHGYGTTIAVNDTSLHLTNLANSTFFDVYVRSVCGFGDSSNWSYTYTFSTACGMIENLPFSESFDNWGIGSSVHAPNCWRYGTTSSTSYYYPLISSFSHNGSTGSIYLYASGNNARTWFSLPELDPNVATVNQTQLAFYIYGSSDNLQHNVAIGVMTTPDDIDNAIWIDTVITNNGEWEEHEISLNNYSDTGRYIVFMSKANPNGSSFPYIDDLSLEIIPSCQRPDSLSAYNATPNSIDLAWNDRANASHWLIEYGPIGFTPGTGTIVATNSNPFTLTNLPTSFHGEYYVKAVCSPYDTGDYSRHACIFNTSQGTATIPYLYNFEDDYEWQNWQNCSNDSTKQWYRGSATYSNENNSFYSMYVSVDSGMTYRPYFQSSILNAAIYRDINFGPIDSSFIVHFDARAGGLLGNESIGLRVLLVDPSLSVAPSNLPETSPWGNINTINPIFTIKRDTIWKRYSASIDNIHGVHRLVFFWHNMVNSNNSYPEPAAIDNISIDYASCPRPAEPIVNSIGSHSVSISWNGPDSIDYEVIYHPYFNENSRTIVQTNTNSILLTNLDYFTRYLLWVRRICSNDTSITSDTVTFTTNLCNDTNTTVFNYDSSLYSNETSFSPIGYSVYNYSYVQTIVGSDYLNHLNDNEISAMAFYTKGLSLENSIASDMFENITVYLANVPESNLTLGYIHPDSNTHVFVKVIDSANFNYDCSTEGLQIHRFDKPFSWDGHSNILVSVIRNNGAHSSSSAKFGSHRHSSVKTRYSFRDSAPYDYAAITGGTISYYVGDIYFLSCSNPNCPKPQELNTTNPTYNSVTINWLASAESFEISYKNAVDSTWSSEIDIGNVSNYNISGLIANTTYMFRVRSVCMTDGDTSFSNWAVINFTTKKAPCFIPTNLHPIEVGHTNTVLCWDAYTTQSQWSIHVWNTSFDHEYTADSNPFTVTELSANTAYYAAVKSVCDNITESEYSDTIQFYTVTCGKVSGITIDTVTTTLASVSWNDNGAPKYEVQYGDRNFNQGEGFSVVVDSNFATLQNLKPNHDYSLYVRAICETGVSGLWSEKIDFSTLKTSVINTKNDRMSIQIYPNPTTNAITIALNDVSGEVQITIVDINGREMMSEKMNCMNECAKILEVSGLSKGVFFVRIIVNNEKPTIKKIVKK